MPFSSILDSTRLPYRPPPPSHTYSHLPPYPHLLRSAAVVIPLRSISDSTVAAAPPPPSTARVGTRSGWRAKMGRGCNCSARGGRDVGGAGCGEA